MFNFQAQQVVDKILQDSFCRLNIVGITSDQWPILLKDIIAITREKTEFSKVIIIVDEDQAESTFDQIYNQNTPYKIFLFPKFISPFQKIIPSSSYLQELFDFLSNFYSDEASGLYIIGHKSFALNLPTKDFFNTNSFSISVGSILSINDLSENLFKAGFYRSNKLGEKNTFVIRGEMIDIYSSRPVRIYYYEDMIEKIRLIDSETFQTTNQYLDSIFIHPTPNILMTDSYKNSFADYTRKFTHNKNQLEKRKIALESMATCTMPDEGSLLFRAFFKELNSFCKNKNTLFFSDNFDWYKKNFSEFLSSLREDFDARKSDPLNNQVLVDPEELFDKNSYMANIRTVNFGLTIDSKNNKEHNDYVIESIPVFNSNKSQAITEIERLGFSNFLRKLKDEYRPNRIIISYTSQTTLDRFKSITKEIEFNVDYENNFQEKSYFFPQSSLLSLAEIDLFGKKFHQPRKSYKSIKKTDVFIDQIASLKVGDFIVYSEHGVGRYLGMESIEHDGFNTDYMIIEYQDNDKIFVPIYRIDKIQKHADASTTTSLSSLRNTKFTKAKDRARESAKKLAFDLLKLYAERQQTKPFIFNPPGEQFKDFEMSFPFDETPDQQSAIENVISALQAERPMDFLVCGDVGFGKTEVAMRAAFKVIEDGKQVAMLAPTTILTLQHYNNFKKRMSNFPIEVEFLSRFKTSTQKKEILSKLSEGKIDVVIGTHGLLSDSVRFKDLGLVVVDEEQRFGVGHKEKLKLLRKSVDFLTLTATPIPRTLQMAFLGIKDLSIIQTPPPMRQSIETHLIYDDDNTIKEAIEYELERGGQIFFVHNRVTDIEIVYGRLQALVPKAKIVIGHGQLPERELEKRMNDFYDGKYDVLLATTIIESGIDIPNANTLIVNKSDMFGLSQLHQLRGRIGRTNKKAYAYFVLPEVNKGNAVALERLKTLKEFAYIGAGFSIASKDLEMRGAGDILGANQSGHIEEIGLELYLELLQNAINELKNIKSINKDVEVITDFPAYIPDFYIPEASERMRLYKNLSKLDNIDQITALTTEVENIYGKAPREFNAYLYLIKSRIVGGRLNIKEVRVFGNKLLLSFNEKSLEDNPIFRDRLIQFLLAQSKKFMFSGSGRVEYINKQVIGPSELLETLKYIEENTLLC